MANRNIRQSAVSGIFNLKRTNTDRLRAAIAKVRANKGNALFATGLDSLTRGTGEGGNTCNANSWPIRASEILTGRGLNSAAWNIFGGNGQSSIDTLISTYDGRISYTGTVTLDTTLDSFGGRLFRVTNGSITFTFGKAIDTIEVVYAFYGSGTASLNVSVDGGATLQTINTNGTPTSIKKATVAAGSLAVHTITLQTAGTALIAGVNAFDSTKKSVQWLNIAAHGATLSAPSTIPPTVASPSTGAYSPYGAMTNFALLSADAYFLMPFTNEARQSIPVDSSPDGAKQRLEKHLTDIQALASVPDTVLMTHPYDGSTSGLVANEDQYIQAIKDVALEFDKPVILVRDRQQSYTRGNALGMYFDTVHQTFAGYADIAAAVGEFIDLAA